MSISSVSKPEIVKYMNITMENQCFCNHLVVTIK